MIFFVPLAYLVSNTISIGAHPVVRFYILLYFLIGRTCRLNKGYRSISFNLLLDLL